MFPFDWPNGWTGLTILKLLIRKPISLERLFQNCVLRNPRVPFEDWDDIQILPAGVLNRPGRPLGCSSLPIEVCAVTGSQGNPAKMYTEAAGRKWRGEA